MVTIPMAPLIQKYRNPNLAWYGPLGHKGVDLAYKTGDELPSPVTGTVVGLHNQTEMGNCMYIKDAWNTIHVFAHLQAFKKSFGHTVQRGEVIAITNNSGSKTSGAHLHYELISEKPDPQWFGRLMSRNLYGFKGYNVDPLNYLKTLYAFYKVPYPS